MAARLLPKTHLRERIRDELADLDDDTVVVTDRGRPSAIIVSVERWNTLQETLEELQDSLAVFEHRADPEASAPAESIFSAIEAELADVRRPARQTG
jgi:PHD/YefM family antitoxin component YafN of YafNO toxin-antitoxin module